MPTPEQVDDFRDANAELIAQVEDRLDEFWAGASARDPVSGLNALLNFVPLLTQQFGELAALLAMDWFEELRFDAIDAGQIAAIGRATTYEAVRTDPVILEISAASASYWQHRLATDGPDVAVSSIKDGAMRAVRLSGRDAITTNADRDPAARGWQRITRSGACRFCRALASRGGVYTRQSVRFAAHGPKCNCVAAPTWNPDVPEADPFVYVASQNTAGMDDEQRRIQRDRVRGWLERKYPGESDHPQGEHTTDGESAD
jgi:hypothetical protein